MTTGDVRLVRCRGGNMKYRALRLDHGNFSWGSENVTRKTRIMDVTYNASNNELVRTKTLVKSAVVQIDAAPFRAWYQQHYGKKIGVKVKNGEKVESEDIDAKRSSAVAKKLKERNAKHAVAANVDAQFVTGRLYALVTPPRQWALRRPHLEGMSRLLPEEDAEEEGRQPPSKRVGDLLFERCEGSHALGRL